MGSNIASPLQGVQHITAFSDALRAEADGTDTSMLLMYIVDVCPPEALYWLAWQFDVLGDGGWTTAAAEADRRMLVKNAIRLHRIKGTPGAIKLALASLGYPGAIVRKGLGITYDGSYQYDGTIQYAGGNWATYRVIIPLPDGQYMDAALVAELRRVIEHYQNARSQLIDVSFSIALADEFTMSDTVRVGDESIVDRLFGALRHDGEADYDGQETYGDSGQDVVNLQVTRNGVNTNYVY